MVARFLPDSCLICAPVALTQARTSGNDPGTRDEIARDAEEGEVELAGSAQVASLRDGVAAPDRRVERHSMADDGSVLPVQRGPRRRGPAGTTSRRAFCGGLVIIAREGYAC